jgi:hypothetical protein
MTQQPVLFFSKDDAAFSNDGIVFGGDNSFE